MSYWKRFGKQLVERDGAFCHYCGAPLMDPTEISNIYKTVPYPESQRIIGGRKWATVDHIQSRSEGGTDDLQNLVLACHDCNAKKGKKSYTDFLVWRAKQ